MPIKQQVLIFLSSEATFGYGLFACGSISRKLGCVVLAVTSPKRRRKYFGMEYPASHSRHHDKLSIRNVLVYEDPKFGPKSFKHMVYSIRELENGSVLWKY